MRGGGIEPPTRGFSVLPEDVPKTLLGQNDNVIDALAADASEEPLAHCVHERRLHCGAQNASANTVSDAVERSNLSVIRP